MYISRELTDLSLPKIGEEFGGRDHTTVIHAYEKISSEIHESYEFKNKIEGIIKEIKGEWGYVDEYFVDKFLKNSSTSG